MRRIRLIGDGFEDLRQESRAKRDNRSEAEIAGQAQIKHASKQPKAARRDATRINGVRRMDFSLVKDKAAAAQASYFPLVLLSLSPAD
jgi:hypothetical protein